MTASNNSASEPGQASLVKPMIFGALLGLVVISFFVLPTTGDPAWGPMWKIKPLIVVPLAGAFWGVCHYFWVRQNFLPLNKTLTMILSALGLILGMWMGIVVGLNGTLWD